MRRRVFTLLELIIAVTVFMMVSVALFTFSSQVNDTWSRLTVERNRFNELLVMDRVIDGILSNAVPFMWRDTGDELNGTMPFIVADEDRLRIAYLHRLNDANEGALRFVEIYLEDGDLMVTYADRPFIDWSEIADDRRKTSLLTTEVESLFFEYADWSSDVGVDWPERLFWRAYWETDDSARTDIPLAIKMTVTWRDGRQECWLRRTTGNSFRERYGTYNLPADNTP
ncbi:MAG: hypothetical protein J5833_03380 [Victivallales bacterium]|nr:hypothetical protein [Victivallales bacterium]